MNYEAIRAAMQEELDNPKAYYIPCSPGDYIRDRLFKQCEWELATWFWGRYCSGVFNVPELDKLMPQLKALTKDEKMPDWGTSGT